jgi:hypothetical protein
MECAGTAVALRVRVDCARDRAGSPRASRRPGKPPRRCVGFRITRPACATRACSTATRRAGETGAPRVGFRPSTAGRFPRGPRRGSRGGVEMARPGLVPLPPACGEPAGRLPSRSASPTPCNDTRSDTAVSAAARRDRPMIVRKQNVSSAQGISEAERRHGLWPCRRPSRLAAARAAETFYRAVDSGHSGNSLGRSPGIMDRADSPRHCAALAARARTTECQCGRECGTGGLAAGDWGHELYQT